MGSGDRDRDRERERGPNQLLHIPMYCRYLVLAFKNQKHIPLQTF